MLTLPPPPPPLPLATHTLLTPTNPFFLCLLLQLQTRSASEENPECHVNREPPHHAPLGPRTHVTWHDPSHRYGYPPVAKALPHWVSSFFCLLLFLSHSYSHTNSFPTSGLPAACPRNGNQSKVTHAPSHQTPAAHSFTKNRSNAQPPQTKRGGE